MFFMLKIMQYEKFDYDILTRFDGSLCSIIMKVHQKSIFAIHCSQRTLISKALFGMSTSLRFVPLLRFVGDSRTF